MNKKEELNRNKLVSNDDAIEADNLTRKFLESQGQHVGQTTRDQDYKNTMSHLD